MLAVLRPREGGLRRGEIFGSTLLQPACIVCLSSFHYALSLYYYNIMCCCCCCYHQYYYYFLVLFTWPIFSV